MKKIKELWGEFKKFISRGNVVDMAVGVIIASAFTAIVTAVTSGILMPLVNWAVTAATGGQGLEGLRTILGTPAFVETVDELGATVQTIDWENTLYIDWGSLINSVINFLLIAVILFAVLRLVLAFSKIAKDVNGVEAKKKRKLIRSNMKAGLSLSEATAKAEETIVAEKKAEEDKKAAEEAAAKAKPTAEQLLAEIRDLLAAQNAKTSSGDIQNKTE